jgi:hypothetical protein
VSSRVQVAPARRVIGSQAAVADMRKRQLENETH